MINPRAVGHTRHPAVRRCGRTPSLTSRRRGQCPQNQLESAGTKAEQTYYPIFVKIGGRNVLVVGGGTVAQRKAAVMLEHGARLTVVSRGSPRAVLALGNVHRRVLAVRFAVVGARIAYRVMGFGAGLRYRLLGPLRARSKAQSRAALGNRIAAEELPRVFVVQGHRSGRIVSRQRQTVYRWGKRDG